MTEVWSVERVEKLKRLYDDGYSFSEIAAELGGGISRNGCIGKAHRLGICGSRPVAKPTGPNLSKKPTSQGVGAAVQKINAARATPKIKPEPFVVAAAPVVPLNISLMELTDETCRWPDGDVEITFCGHPAHSGPYCAAHSRLARKPPVARGGSVGRAA